MNAKKKDKEKKKDKDKKGKNKRMKKDDMLQRITSLFESSPSLPLNYKQVSKEIGVDSQVQKLQVSAMLEDLALGGYLKEVDRGRYCLNHIGTIAEGTFVRRSNGKNSFIPDGEGTPVFIAERNSAHAMDGDRVKVQLFARRKGAEPEGEVV